AYHRPDDPSDKPDGTVERACNPWRPRDCLATRLRQHGGSQIVGGMPGHAPPIREILTDAGFPPGVVNAISHRAKDAPEVVSALIGHPAPSSASTSPAQPGSARLLRDSPPNI